MSKILNIGLLISALVVMLNTATIGVATAKPLSVDHWAIREVAQNAAVNPAGTKLAYMSNPSREGDPIVEIYDINDLDGKPRRVGAKFMEIQGLNWISDDHLLVFFRQKVRKKIEGFNQGVYEGSSAIYNAKTNKFGRHLGNLQIENLLPKQPKKVLISLPNDKNAISFEEDPFAPFRPRTYYVLDLDSGRKELVLKGSERNSTATFDDDGNPRFSVGYDRATREFVYYARSIGENSWRELMRLDSYKLEGINVVSTLPEEPDVALAVAQNGNDKAGLWELDLKSGKFGELLYQRSDVDVASVRMHSQFWGQGTVPVGVNYFGAKLETEWFDAQEEAFIRGLEAAIPNAHQVSVTSRSRDGNIATILNIGPKDSGSYYLYKNGGLQLIGSRNPLVKAEHLSELRYVKYPTRDGKEVAGYLTVPKGKGPHPLIVLPHGGPFVSEIIRYDEWGQFLANNGYMVLQPQYRGSLGYGIDHWESAYDQAGLKMQDDKDDGALWLVQQGLADPDRLAMFGWSYGGYAALVAAARSNNIYQCAIAGAAVSDPNMQLNYYRDQLIPATEYWELRRRKGIQPIDEAHKVNIPLLIIHGDVDQRVPLDHYKIYVRALKKHGIPYKGVLLEGADHFSNTLFFNHQKKLYTSMLDFLKNDCGPGGL